MKKKIIENFKSYSDFFYHHVMPYSISVILFCVGLRMFSIQILYFCNIYFNKFLQFKNFFQVKSTR